MSRLTRHRGVGDLGLMDNIRPGSVTWDTAVLTCRAQLSAVRPRSRYSSLSGPPGHAAIARRLRLGSKNRFGLWVVLRRLLGLSRDAPSARATSAPGWPESRHQRRNV